MDPTQAGGDMGGLEDLFEAEPDTGNSEGQNVGQNQSQQQEPQLDENGEPIVEVVIDENNGVAEEVELELDENGEPIVKVDPNAPVVLEVPDDHEVKLTIDGKEVAMTFGDLKAGAQKYEAANKRFEEAAQIRKEYTDKSQTLVQREQQLGQVLEHYIRESSTLMQSQQPDWAKLIAEEPQRYLVERHNWELKQQQLAQAAQIQANLQRQQAEQNAVSARQRAEEAKQQLVAAIPDWRDPQKLAAGAKQIDEYLATQGIPPEMVAQIDTAGVVLIARKAMLYDQAIAKQQAARRQGGARPVGQQQQTPVGQQRQQPQVRVERPGAARSVAQTAASQQNLAKANVQKRFDANPSVDTLAGFFE